MEEAKMKRIQEFQEKEVEGFMARQDYLDGVKEDELKAEKERERKQKLKEEFIEGNEEAKKRKREKLIKEREEEKKREQFRLEKDRLEENNINKSDENKMDNFGDKEKNENIIEEEEFESKNNNNQQPKKISIRKYYPMLAYQYNLKKSEIKFPCYVQPKLDGVRCVVVGNKLYSRNGNRFPELPHIEDDRKD